jgi:hypothetical protein
MADQNLQQLELTGGQVHGLFAFFQGALGQVEHKGAKAKPLGRGGGFGGAMEPAQTRLDAGQQFSRVDGFDQKVIGTHLERDHRFPRRALQQGHDLGNHLWIDESSAGLPPAVLQQQLADTERVIARAAAPAQLHWRWFRPGGGWFHRAMLDALASRSYRLVLGSIFPWDTLRPPLWFVRLFVRLNAHPGGILVLHDTPALSGRTLETLRQIVPELRQRGYRFVPLQELLDPAP